MLRPFKQFGDLLDRWDVGGWLLLASGMLVLSVTLLAPAWVDVRHLDAQVLVLNRQAQMLQKQHENYESFIHAVQSSDPMLIQRLAWHHLRLKPAGTQLVNAVEPITDQPAPSIDRWTQADIPPLPENILELTLPNSRLVRLVMGPSRPWVFAFGGWLVLMGLLINPSASRPKAPVKVTVAPAPQATVTVVDPATAFEPVAQALVLDDSTPEVAVDDVVVTIALDPSPLASAGDVADTTVHE